MPKVVKVTEWDDEPVSEDIRITIEQDGEVVLEQTLDIESRWQAHQKKTGGR